LFFSIFIIKISDTAEFLSEKCLEWFLTLTYNYNAVFESHSDEIRKVVSEDRKRPRASPDHIESGAALKLLIWRAAFSENRFTLFGKRSKTLLLSF